MKDKTYNNTLATLFGLLALANEADTEDAQPWQHRKDVRQSDNEMYHSVHKAIEAIAGSAILEHWAECNEVDFSLANRKGN